MAAKEMKSSEGEASYIKPNGFFPVPKRHIVQIWVAVQ